MKSSLRYWTLTMDVDYQKAKTIAMRKRIYHNNALTLFIFSLFLQQIVTINFTDFELGSYYDVVTLHDGIDMGAPTIEYLHGSYSSVMVFSSSQRDMFIQFTTDASGNGKGFSAMFYSAKPNAG